MASDGSQHIQYLRKSIFESCQQVIRCSISELSFKHNGIEKNLVPLWNFGNAGLFDKRINVHCLYLIFLNVICERSGSESLEQSLIVLEKVLTRCSDEYEVQIFMAMGETQTQCSRSGLNEILFSEYSAQFLWHSQSNPLDLFIFVYLGILQQKYQHVLEGITAFISNTLALTSPSLEYSIKSEDQLYMIMHAITELSLVMSLFHYGLYTTLLKSDSDAKVFPICDNIIQFLSVHKALLILCVFAVRFSHFSLAFGLERYDVIDILLDDIDQFKKPFDFQLYFKLFHKLDKSIVVQDVFEANSSSRHRSYSIHTQGLWNKIDPIINEAIQNNTAAFNIDEGYKYITFLSREECSEILKDKPFGSFLVRPQSNIDSNDISSSEEYFTQFLLSFRSPPNNNGSTSPGDNVKHAVIRRERGSDGSFKYRCGKLGPTADLNQILKDISGILSSGLKFDQIVPSAIPLFDSSHGKNDVHNYSKRDIYSLVDANHRFHTAIYMYLPTLLNNVMVDPRLSRKFSVDNFDDVEDDEISVGSGDTASSVPDKFEGLMLEESAEEYELEKSDSGYHDVSYTVLRFLSWKRFLVQSVPLMFLFEIFVSNDLDFRCYLMYNMVPVEQSIYHMFQSMIISELYNTSVFYSVQTVILLEDIFEGDTKEYKYESMLQLFAPVLRFLMVSEEKLIKTMLIPPFSSSMMRQNRNNCGLTWYYGNTYRDREALVVEAMLQRFLRNASPMAVKVNASTNGLASGSAESVWMMDCVETNILIPTMGQFLAHLDEFLNQPIEESSKNEDLDYLEEKSDPFYEVEGESTMEDSVPADTLSNKIRENLERRKNQQLFYRDSVVGDTLKKITSPLDNLFSFQPTNTNNRSVPTNGAVTATNQDPHHGVTISHDKKMLQLLSIVKDILCHSNFPYYPYSTIKSMGEEVVSSNNISVDMAQRVITLLYRHKSLRQFVKPAELAFLSNISYYKYVDLWEVKAAADEIMGARELLTLGRHVYRSPPVEVTDSHRTKSPYLSIACNLFCKGRNAARDQDTSEQLNIELKPFANLWLKVRAEEYILNAIVKYPSYLVNDTNKPMVTPYIQALNHHLFKNVMLKRLHLPYRFCGFVQFDLYGLKQVLGTKNIGKRSDDALVTPSQSAHQSPIEVFAVIKLIKNYKVDDSGGVLYADSIFHSGNPDQLAQSGTSARSIQEGSFVTSAKRVEPHFTSGHNKKAESDSGSNHGSNGNNASNSKAVLAQISQSFDYDFRSKACFRFALPECWIETFLNQNPDGGPMHGQEELYGHIRSSPPLKIAVSVYEKMFFGDVKIGQTEIDMSQLTETAVIRDWFPLRTENPTFSWMLYSQAKLRFQLLQMDDLPDEFPYNNPIDFDRVVTSPKLVSKENVAVTNGSMVSPSSRLEISRSMNELSVSIPSVKLPSEPRPVNEAQVSPASSTSSTTSTTVPSVTSTGNHKSGNLMASMKSVFSPAGAAASNVASNVASNFIHAVGKPIQAATSSVSSGPTAKTEKPPPTKSKTFLSHLDDLF